MTPAVLDETLEKRMRDAEIDVAREFESLDRELVHSQFERVSNELLRNATVTDFVPVLARRHAREALRSMPAARPARSVVEAAAAAQNAAAPKGSRVEGEPTARAQASHRPPGVGCRSMEMGVGW